MKSSSSSSSVPPTSVTAGTQLLSSSSSPPPYRSLRSPELQAEFLQECRNKFQSHSDVGDSSVFSPPPSPLAPPCSSSSSSNNRQARLSLSSPELLSELRESRTRSLRHVPAHKALTTVFHGRGGRGGGRGRGRGRGGGQACGPAPSTPSANQKT